MNRLILTALAVLPSGALAHGAHPPVAEAAHGAAHLLLGLVLAVVAVAGLLAIVRRVGK